MHAEGVGLSNAEAAQKGGNVEVLGPLRDFVPPLTRFIDKGHSSGIASFQKLFSWPCRFAL